MAKPFWEQIEDIDREQKLNCRISSSEAELELVESIFDDGGLDDIIEVEEYYGDGIYIVKEKLRFYIEQLKDKRRD